MNNTFLLKTRIVLAFSLVFIVAFVFGAMTQKVLSVEEYKYPIITGLLSLFEERIPHRFALL